MFWLGLYFACMPFTYLFCQWRIKIYQEGKWALLDQIALLSSQLFWPVVVVIVAVTTDWIDWEKPAKW